MEHIAAFMILIACNGGYDDCAEKPAPSVAYESVQECEAELSPSIRMMAARNEHALGKCVEIDPALFYEDAELVWDVTDQGEVEVALELINPEMDLQTVAQSSSVDDNHRLN